MHDATSADAPLSGALSINEVAKRIGRSEVATRRAVERGEIPARKWGRRVIILRAELAEFLQGLPARGGTRQAEARAARSQIEEALDHLGRPWPWHRAASLLVDLLVALEESAGA